MVTAAVAGAVVLADQATKSAAEAHLTHPVHVLGPFGLNLGYNSGSAFSLFTGHSPVLVAVDLVLVGVLVAPPGSPDGPWWRWHWG